MPPTTSRDVQKVAAQRLTTAEALLRAKLTLDAQYIIRIRFDTCARPPRVGRPASFRGRVRAHGLNRMRIRGYSVECSLKAPIPHRTADADKPEKLKRITAGAKTHRPDVRLGELRDLGVARPLEIAKRMRRFDWTTDLRYALGRRDTGETTAALRTAKAVYDWVEGQLP